MNKSRIILIGGFLGSGKTTLMHRVAAMLSENGTKVGLITNDQATALVDTGYLERSAGTFTEEVSGSCFCCNFPGLEGAIDSLLGKIGEQGFERREIGHVALNDLGLPGKMLCSFLAPQDKCADGQLSADQAADDGAAEVSGRSGDNVELVIGIGDGVDGGIHD